MDNMDKEKQQETQNTQPVDKKERPQTQETKDITLKDEELKKICEEKFCSECEQLKGKQQEVLRILADSENLKKRLIREKEEFCKFATSTIIEDILPIMDNLELAITHGQKTEACKDLLQGVEMTLKMFKETLKKHGLEPVGEEGEKFDPNIHEAMAQEEREDMEEGMVCQLMQKGYKLHDRLLRPARVMVSKKSEKK
ncbi:nucleotide exchange factor GrpE [Desulfohalobiaceae bacterium Ax17]|uniref:nucleotide exchange factor GrpE n=1 Tax=Desulfovulcanus ferrireducens TaxID=2831190 RepID=UPI00207B99F3|nr:nucleotide exchange factor GrpE [Desulfovulcanus ferrireducens]MBT8763585.1 nucleotide exchange factor GrpE [Desulfovulcanus ferrireducens]